jgi:hypothetical protein
MGGARRVVRFGFGCPWCGHNLPTRVFVYPHDLLPTLTAHCDRCDRAVGPAWEVRPERLPPGIYEDVHEEVAGEEEG